MCTREQARAPFADAPKVLAALTRGFRMLISLCLAGRSALLSQGRPRLKAATTTPIETGHPKALALCPQAFSSSTVLVLGVS